jgi:hypothetical protein
MRAIQWKGEAVTDRHADYVVVLDQDIRDDDAEAVSTALRMVKGALTIEPLVASPEVHIAEQRARHEFRTELYNLAKEWS